MHPASRTFLGPTIAGRTSQAATRVEKKTASAPSIAAASSHKSSEANTTDPSLGPSRPRAAPSIPCAWPFAPALNKRPVKSPLARLRQCQLRHPARVRCPGDRAPHHAGRTRYPIPDCPPSPKARTRDPDPTSSSLPPLSSVVYFISRHYGMQLFLRSQVPGPHLAHIRGRETRSSLEFRSVDSLTVSCILYHRNRQSSVCRR